MKELKKEIKRLMKEAKLDPADYGGTNEYFNEDNNRLLIAKKTIHSCLEEEIDLKKFENNSKKLWGGRLHLATDGSLEYTAGQYWPLEVVECLADVLKETVK